MKTGWKNDTQETWSVSALFGNLRVSIYVSKNEGKWFGGIKAGLDYFISPTGPLNARTAKTAMAEMMNIFNVLSSAFYSRICAGDVK